MALHGSFKNRDLRPRVSGPDVKNPSISPERSSIHRARHIPPSVAPPLPHLQRSPRSTASQPLLHGARDEAPAAIEEATPHQTARSRGTRALDVVEQPL